MQSSCSSGNSSTRGDITRTNQTNSDNQNRYPNLGSGTLGLDILNLGSSNSDTSNG